MCADILDEAAEHTQHMIDLALANRNKPQMQFTGACHYCEEKVDKGHFCSHECREDSEKIARASIYRRG